MKNQSQNDKVYRIDYSDDMDAYMQWVELLSHRISRSALHIKDLKPKVAEKLKNGLSPKSREVLARILFEYSKLKKSIPDNPSMVQKLALSSEMKKSIREQCDMAPANFNGLIALYREIGVIANINGCDVVKPSFIPDFETGTFMVSFLFKHKENDIV